MVDDPTIAKLSPMPRRGAVGSPAPSSADRRTSDTRIGAEFRNLFLAHPGGRSKVWGFDRARTRGAATQRFFSRIRIFRGPLGVHAIERIADFRHSSASARCSGTDYFPCPRGGGQKSEGTRSRTGGMANFCAAQVLARIFLEGLALAPTPQTAVAKNSREIHHGGVGYDRIRRRWRLR